MLRLYLEGIWRPQSLFHGLLYYFRFHDLIVLTASDFHEGFLRARFKKRRKQ